MAVLDKDRPLRSGTTAAGGPPSIVTVHAAHPHASSFAYTVEPWSEDGRGIISLGPDPSGVAEIVTGVNRLEPSRQRGDVVAITTREGAMAVRLVRCEPASVEPYVLLRDSRRVPQYLQAVPVADRRRSWRVDDCECCPDLARSGSVYRKPFSVDDGATYRWQRRRVLPPRDVEAVELVEVPARVLGRPEGRAERLVVERLDEHQVRLLQAPAIADWTSAGAVHAREADGLIGGVVRPGLSQFGVAVSTVGRAAWDPAPAVLAALDRLTATDGIAVTFTGSWLAVAAGGRHAEPARSVLRRLVRDGHATEVGSYADPVDTDDCCDICRTFGGSGRPGQSWTR